MSSLILEFGQIDGVSPHENADLLEIAIYKGWQSIIKKGQFRPGDTCVYFPPDVVLPKALSDELGVTNYLKGLGLRYPGQERFGGRVGVARLRGVPSYGFLVSPNPEWWSYSHNLAEHLGVEKYEPPEEILEGDAERTNPFFHKYTDMENLRHFPVAFRIGEMVVATEKIHGRNCRIGYCYEEGEMTVMAGSHLRRRKQFTQNGTLSVYWQPLELYPQLQPLLHALWLKYMHNVIIFGELYGGNLQDLSYGHRDVQFRVFDISVNTLYLSYELMQEWLSKFNVPAVPVLYTGRYSFPCMEAYATGASTVSLTPQIREGIVVRSLEDQTDQMGLYGRKCFKLLNFDYLHRQGGTELH